MSQELDRQVNVKFSQAAYEKLEDVSERFRLRLSDVVRRAVAEGLKAFETARLPGSDDD
jgi:hypothetical protein